MPPAMLGTNERSDMSTTEQPTANRPYVLPRDAGLYDVWFPTIPNAPGRYRAKVTAEQTDGRLAQVHIVEHRGAAAPLHLHRDADETFYVIDGQVSFFLGKERIDARAGAFLLAPRGAVHSWLIRSEEAEALVTLAPAGLEGFFAEIGSQVVPSDPAAGSIQIDVEELNRRAAAYGVEIVGQPPTLED
jgi:quercetin dioxygenase-like cupin family protein